nr:TRAP transporter small permease [uncultured Cohaesibacter sp.]
MRLLRYCEKTLEALVALFMFCLVAMVFTNVILRFGFNSGIVVTEELSRIVLSMLILTGAIVAMVQQRHIAMTLLVDRFSPVFKKITVMVTGSIMLYGTWLLGSGAWMQAKLNFSSNYPLSGLPSATIYVVASFSAAMLCLIIFARMMLILIGKMPADRFFQAASADVAE